MEFGPLQRGAFRERLNRFACLVTIAGAEEQAHLPNSGRLQELLLPGREVRLAPASSPGRRTRWDLKLVAVDGLWACADARLPPLLLEEAVRQGRARPFFGYRPLRREVPFGHGRLDLLLARDGDTCLVETKSVTLVVKGSGLFPDAPTERGRQHVLSLMAARQAGSAAAIVFVIQREDALAFAPNDATDPQFGAALRLAAARGVGVFAFICRVSPAEIAIAGEVPVRLEEA